MTRIVCIGFALILVGQTSPLSQTPRPMTVEDLFAIQTLTDVRISPDGTSIAVAIQRAWSDPETYRPYFMFGNDHSDIWILPAAGGAARNITGGARDGSGYWNPVWAPDGEHLALLSTAGGDNVRAYIWNRQSGRLTRVAERGVDLRARTNATGESNPIQWVDHRRLLIAVLPENEQPHAFRIRRQTPRIASEAWNKALLGGGPTASVLEGGLPPAAERANQLLLVDAATLRTRILAEGNIQSALVSPDRRHLALVTQARRPLPAPGKLLGSVGSAPSRLGIVTLEQESGVRWVDGAFNPVVGFGLQPHRWSPASLAVAVLGTERAETDSPRALFVVSPVDLSVRRAAQALMPAAIAWSEREHLLVQARTPGQGDRTDWWIVPAGDGEPRNVTSGLPAVPGQLSRTHNGNAMVGLIDGALWRVDLTEGQHVRLADGRPPVAALVWPSAEDRLASAVTSIVVRVRDGAADALLRVDPATGTIADFPKPPKAANLAAYHADRNLAVFTAPHDPDGTFVWTAPGGAADFAQRISLNRQLATIAGTVRLIDYRSIGGELLKGILLLPAGFRQGARYPLVTFVYPGVVIREISRDGLWYTKNQAHMDNLHVLAGHGYAVLIASMPGINPNSPGLSNLTNGVLPAVDRAVELGIADPDRVAVMGQSGGGFVTYGLITQTNRFKAAVAIAGPSNHLTWYGVFSGETRYVNDVDEIRGGSSEGPFGSPPWVDPDPYVRNSPVLFMNRVETPLLILHGDIDYVPIQHAEEVFTSLFRMGKRVRFVRYWGESHGAGDAPANIRDRWQQIFAWLDAYLR